jgi:ABC-type branched-subunit amino acid transport system ATPase component
LFLEVKDIDSGYGFLQVLWKVSLHVDEGEYVCLIGPNGAGKSTMLKTITGLVAPIQGKIFFRGTSIGRLSADEVCQLGISYISEETNLFTAMTVRENLAMGAFTVRDKTKQKENLDFVFELFPRLRERQHQLAGTMSGGERKMLAIGRGMMATPTLLLVDEPSLGLAPQVTADVFKALDALRKRGVTLLLVEQNVTKTLQVTDRGYILEKGRIVLADRSQNLSRNEHVRKVFLGV